MEGVTDGQKANLPREKAFSCLIFPHHSHFLSSLSLFLSHSAVMVISSLHHIVSYEVMT